MARVGISKTYAAGALTDVTALFGLIKQMIVDAGFYVVTNTSDRIEFMPAGTTPAADTNDDTPHYTIYQVGTDQIKARALYGLAWNDGGVKSGAEQIAIDTPIQFNDGGGDLDSVLELRAAADGREGWFWIAAMQYVWHPIEELEAVGYHHLVAGTASRRLSADQAAGYATRYGIFTDAGVFAPAYAIDWQGASAAPELGWWSPVCADGNGSNRISAGIGPLAAPVYPRQIADMKTVLYGDLADVMTATDGYAHLSTTAIPGWIVYAPEYERDADLVLRAPASFTPV